MVNAGNPPQQATQFDNNHYYFLPRPQALFGGDTGTPPIVEDFEVAEQVAAVFDNVIYNESGGGDDGQLVVTQS